MTTKRKGTKPKRRQPKTHRTAWRNSGHSQNDVSTERRKTLLRKATLAFRNWNYHDITMDQIAENLGVAKPTLYNYVRGKQEILYEGHKLSMDFADQAIAASEAAGGLAADRLAVFCQIYTSLLADGQGGAAISLFFEALPEPQRSQIEARRRSHRVRFERLIEDGVREGGLRPVEPAVASYFWLGAVNWLMKWYRPGKSVDGLALGKQFADIFVHGIAKAAHGRDVGRQPSSIRGPVAG